MIRNVLSIAARAGALAGFLLLAVPADAQDAVRFVQTLRIGELEGDPNEVFGLIGDVASDHEGHIAVLDGQAQRVQIFSPSGRFLQQLGRPGRGPGEFMVPVAIAFDSTGALYVVDVANQRVEIFRRRGGQMERSGSFPIDHHVTDMCSMGSELFLLGHREGHMVNVYNPEGRRLRSFGVPQHAADDYLRRAFSDGVIACLESPRSILVLPLLSDRLQAFAIDGSALWQSRIPEYEPVAIRRRDGATIFSMGPTGRHHMASSISAVGPGTAIVQVGFIGEGARRPEEMTNVTSYLVRVDPGRVMPMSAGTPRIVFMNRSTGYSAQSDPHPHVTVYRVVVPAALLP